MLIIVRWKQSNVYEWRTWQVFARRNLKLARENTGRYAAVMAIPTQMLAWRRVRAQVLGPRENVLRLIGSLKDWFVKCVDGTVVFTGSYLLASADGTRAIGLVDQ